ncbi:MAG: 23S rRNA pseudouridine(1911/1915/1917) synthase RluD [Pseudomonadales bacterium]|nr:23S rRNA pseudouridine(1911/1915/1917) synthase RluD [Pseudomonadales bacterium]
MSDTNPELSSQESSLQTVELQAEVPDELAGKRFDQIASQLFSEYSRSRIQLWIKEGQLTVDGEVRKPKEKLMGGERLMVLAELLEDESWEPADIPLNIVYEDEALLVVNKPQGLVVHPAAGHRDDTLLNGLLHHWPPLATLPRAGIVHRIDKDTTGLLVVAKTLPAHSSLVAQMQAKTVFREYQAITYGVMTGGGMVDEPIGRHPTQRVKQAVHHAGKDAVTHYRVIERFRAHTHVRVQLETGRTHQIRVHMAHIGYPLLGDQVYAGRLRLPKGASQTLIDALRDFKRQALHARTLGIEHPVTGEVMEWSSELPEDMSRLLTILREDVNAS